MERVDRLYDKDVHLPSGDDPGWRGAGERHRQFLDRHPDLDEEFEEQYLLLHTPPKAVDEDG